MAYLDIPQGTLLKHKLIGFSMVAVVSVALALAVMADKANDTQRKDASDRALCVDQYNTEACHQRRIELLKLNQRIDEIRKQM